jgi:hypothetical protein
MEDLVREERKEESRGVEEAIALPHGCYRERGKSGVFCSERGLWRTSVQFLAARR